MKRRHKAFLIVAGTLVFLVLTVLFVVLPIVLAVIGRDEPPYDDSDLILERPEIAEEENGFTYTLEAARVLDWPGYKPPKQQGGDEKAEDISEQEPGKVEADENKKKQERLDRMLCGPEWDAALADEVLEKNKETFALLGRAMACPGFQVPEPVGIDCDMSSQYCFIPIANLVGLRACALMREGKQEEALQEAITIVQFGHRVENAKGPMVTYFIGRTVKGIGLHTLRWLLAKCTLMPDRLRRYAQQLAESWPDEEGLCDTARVEYQLEMGVVQEFREGKYVLNHIKEGTEAQRKAAWAGWLSLGVRFKPNETRRLFAEAFRPILENASKPYASMEMREPPVHREWRDYGMIDQILAGNIVGRMLYCLLAADARAFLSRKCAGQTKLAATQTLIALKCFKAETGRLPDSLDELVPRCLDAMPLDDFDGKPIRYSREKKILYSIGEDLKDDGGFTEEEGKAWAKEHLYLDEGEEPDPWQLPDPSWSIEF